MELKMNEKEIELALADYILGLGIGVRRGEDITVELDITDHGSVCALVKSSSLPKGSNALMHNPNDGRPDRETFKKYFYYRPDSGKLYHKRRVVDDFTENTKGYKERMCKAWNKKHANKEAGNTRVDGYRCVKLFGKSYLLHRVIFVMMTGNWPIEVDHKNHNKADNRWVNLEAVTHSENGRNRSLSVRNTSGFTGVVPAGNKWKAQICAGGKTKHLGVYDTFEGAVAARAAANLRWGFSENHGL